MRPISLGLLALLCSLLPLAAPLKVIVGPGKTECVSETVDADHFEVGLSLRYSALVKCLCLVLPLWHAVRLARAIH
jgi:hypothetical protein